MATIFVATTALAAPAAGAGPGRFNHTATVVVVPAVTLVDDRGAAVQLDELLATAEPVALQFIFTSCPGVCPTLTSTLAALGRKVPEARLVSISIDPEVDTPARLAEYKEQFGAAESWRFLTGTSAASIAAQQAFASYRGEKMRHQPLTFLKPGGSKSWLRVEGFPTVAELVAALVGSPHPRPLSQSLHPTHQGEGRHLPAHSPHHLSDFRLPPLPGGSGGGTGRGGSRG